MAEPYRNAGLPLYSSATLPHGFCSVPNTPVDSIANINFRRKHPRFITPSVPFAERRIIEMSSILEAAMVICFGASWPLSLYKSITSRTARGKSLLLPDSHRVYIRHLRKTGRRKHHLCVHFLCSESGHGIPRHLCLFPQPPLGSVL